MTASPEGGRSPTRSLPSARRYVAPIALFILAGIPAVALLWDAINHLFAGRIEGTRLLLGFGGLVALILLLTVLARTLTRWEAHRSGEH